MLPVPEDEEGTFAASYMEEEPNDDMFSYSPGAVQAEVQAEVRSGAGVEANAGSGPSVVAVSKKTAARKTKRAAGEPELPSFAPGRPGNAQGQGIYVSAPGNNRSDSTAVVKAGTKKKQPKKTLSLAAGNPQGSAKKRRVEILSTGPLTPRPPAPSPPRLHGGLSQSQNSLSGLPLITSGASGVQPSADADHRLFAESGLAATRQHQQQHHHQYQHQHQSAAPPLEEAAFEFSAGAGIAQGYSLPPLDESTQQADERQHAAAVAAAAAAGVGGDGSAVTGNVISGPGVPSAGDHVAVASLLRLSDSIGPIDEAVLGTINQDTCDAMAAVTAAVGGGQPSRNPARSSVSSSVDAGGGRAFSHIFHSQTADSAPSLHQVRHKFKAFFCLRHVITLSTAHLPAFCRPNK